VFRDGNYRGNDVPDVFWDDIESEVVHPPAVYARKCENLVPQTAPPAPNTSVTWNESARE
jgi:hypothetical protein